LPREDTRNQQVIDGFLFLITQQTFLVMLKTTLSKTICSPALIMHDQPHEKMAFAGYTCLGISFSKSLPWKNLHSR
jgi:hypothetical protein